MNVDFDYIDPKLLDEDDRIIAYLKGKMTKEEETAFMQELRNNPELKAKAIATARLVKGMKELGAKQDKEAIDAFLVSRREDVERAVESVKQRNRALAEVEKEIARNASSAALTPSASKNDEDYIDNGGIAGSRITLDAAASKSKYTILKWMSAAASVLAIVWLGIGYNDYRKTTRLGEVFFESFTIVEHEYTKGPETSKEIEAKLKFLYDNVKNKENLAETIHELALYWELSTMDVYNDYTDYSAEIGWCLAIAYLKDNNKKEAKKVLEKLIDSSEDGSPMNLKANELLSEINDL